MSDHNLHCLSLHLRLLDILLSREKTFFHFFWTITTIILGVSFLELSQITRTLLTLSNPHDISNAFIQASWLYPQIAKVTRKDSDYTV